MISKNNILGKTLKKNMILIAPRISCDVAREINFCNDVKNVRVHNKHSDECAVTFAANGYVRTFTYVQLANSGISQLYTER